MSAATEMTILEAWTAEEARRGIPGIRVSYLDIAGEEVALVNDGQTMWIADAEVFRAALDLEIGNSLDDDGNPDWYTKLCFVVDHDERLAAAYEAEMGQTPNWP